MSARRLAHHSRGLPRARRGETEPDDPARGRPRGRAKLGIFEPPRFFEALLRGRSFMEAP
ncbi:MAG: hypothetical protein R2712_18400 [Vicinamibacterales bacterium]